MVIFLLCCVVFWVEFYFHFLYHPPKQPYEEKMDAFPISQRLREVKSLQSCPTLCDPVDCSPLGSPVPGILQERTLEWVHISFSNVWKWKVKVKSLSRVRLLATPWTAAYQAPPSMGFSRQEYWSGVPLPSPERLSHCWSGRTRPLLGLSGPQCPPSATMLCCHLESDNTVHSTLLTECLLWAKHRDGMETGWPLFSELPDQYSQDN